MVTAGQQNRSAFAVSSIFARPASRAKLPVLRVGAAALGNLALLGTWWLLYHWVVVLVTWFFLNDDEYSLDSNMPPACLLRRPNTMQ